MDGNHAYPICFSVSARLCALFFEASLTESHESQELSISTRQSVPLVYPCALMVRQSKGGKSQLVLKSSLWADHTVETATGSVKARVGSIEGEHAERWKKTTVPRLTWLRLSL
jgi:hypothetical protein